MILSKQRLATALVERVNALSAANEGLSPEAIDVGLEYAVGRIMEGKARDLQEAVNIWAGFCDGFTTMRKKEAGRAQG